MIIKIDGNDSLSTLDIQNYFISKAFDCLNMMNVQNSLEWQKWKKYLKVNFNLSLYDSIKKIIDCSKIIKDEDNYIINIIASPLNDKLTTESLAKLLMSGNLTIKRSNILNNMIRYSIL